ncbi:hypothetical protein K474DRAFT_1685411 [Panus rudis PR-1116 ss-1]|nr:hypothetical protein K474DRAFT_1685411 [Panus rudis PR-1116 ss-1]
MQWSSNPENTSAPAVLASSLRYGIVSRSHPLTGKILRGYLDAAGTLNGFGIGNPNAEFSPDLTKCALTSEGNTAKVLWGFRDGTLAMTVVPKAMENGRTVTPRYHRLPRSQGHAGAVEDVIWVPGNAFAITGGADGTVKLWDLKEMQCVWDGAVQAAQLAREPCLKVAVDVNHGIITGVTKGGDVSIWTGLDSILRTDAQPAREIRNHRIPSPIRAESVNIRTAESDANISPREVTALHLYCSSPEEVSVFVSFSNSTSLHRISVHLPAGNITQSKYTDNTPAIISCLQPVFSTKMDEASFIVAGDQSGYVKFYPLSTSSGHTLPSWKFEAHDDGAITALFWDPTVLVTGSTASIKVFDATTFACLRTFAYPGHRPSGGAAPDPVSNIIVRREYLVATCGDRVMAWHAGPVGNHKSTIKGKGRSSRSSVAKWHVQLEMYRDIAESRKELEDEQAYTRQAFGREREQHSTLEHLGLSEVEAVEYVLMLSREEEERRRQAARQYDEGVFMGDFDEQTPGPTEAQFFSQQNTSSTSALGPSSSPLRSAQSHDRMTRRYIPGSSQKVQISPRIIPEPMEVGPSISPTASLQGSSYSDSSSSLPSRDRSRIPSPDDPNEFPSMSSTPTRQSIVGSYDSTRSAWSTPLRTNSGFASASMSTSPGARRSPPSGATSPRGLVTSMSGLTLSSPGHGGGQSEISDLEAREAEELRYAIELSLAEARSRGENV